MGRRKLVSGDWSYKNQDPDVVELEEAVHLAVITKVPEKYLLIDLETGQIYRGSVTNNEHLPGYKLWKKLD